MTPKELRNERLGTDCRREQCDLGRFDDYSRHGYPAGIERQGNT